MSILDSPVGDLNVAEARFNNMHRWLIGLENAMKMGVSFDDESVQGYFALLERTAHLLPATYKQGAAASRVCAGADERSPLFTEREGRS